MVEMKKEGRTSSQFVSERDAAYLELRGWERVDNTEKAVPVSTLAQVVVKRPGRPRKEH